MKDFLIGFAIGFGLWFLLAWIPQFARSWINAIRFRIARKKAKPGDKWIFEDKKKEGKK